MSKDLMIVRSEEGRVVGPVIYTAMTGILAGSQLSDSLCKWRKKLVVKSLIDFLRG